MLSRSLAIVPLSLCYLLPLGSVLQTAAQADSPAGALARLPIREVTVFKDGHAFILHEGKLQANDAGEVVLDFLPTPIMGTFWPFVADQGRTLRSVVAARSDVPREEPAVSLSELLEANLGASVAITEQDNVAYEASVLAVPKRPVPPPVPGSEPPSPAVSRFGYPARNPFAVTPIPLPSPPAEEPSADIVLLQRGDGVRAVALDRIRDVTFKTPPNQKLRRTEQRNTLTLQLDRTAAASEGSTSLGLAYLQKGIRWIPSYRVEIDGQGNAQVKLQATLINELADLEDVTLHLVVGVPNFAFKDQVDPISLQENITRLSSHFQPGARTAHALSNAIASQTPGYVPQAEPVASPEQSLMSNTEGVEDLFVFRIEHVSLAKGRCMVVPVKEYTIRYTDVYTLDVDIVPPPELRMEPQHGENPELTKLMAAPKVMHKLRLKNSTDAPFTTAPALILSQGRALAQNLLTYTAPGGQTDLEVTAAVDIRVVKKENETGRQANAMNWRGHDYDRIDLEGSVSLTSYHKQPVEIEVTRRVLGIFNNVEQQGKVVQTSAFEEDPVYQFGYPYWWRWYSWPWWWRHVNPLSRAAWKITLEHGQTIELDYTWCYFWD